MPLNKSRSRSGVSSIKINSTVKETEIKYTIELDKFKNQVKLLQQQIEVLQNEITTLKKENIILKQHSEYILSTVESNKRKKVNIIHNEIQSEFANQGGFKVKGCNCKGNCSSKICGCVKKEQICQEFCRCNQSQCKNQDLNKENEQAILSKDGQHILEKLGGLTLNQEMLYASGKKAKRSIFSPLGGNRGTLTGDDIYPASSLTFISKRHLLNRNSNESVNIKSNAETIDEKAKSDTILNNYNIRQTSQKTKSKKNVIHSPQSLKVKYILTTPQLKYNPIQHVEKNEDVGIDRKELNLGCIEVQHSPQLSLCKTQHKSETNNDNSAVETSDKSFNPMIPKRQLPRSPVIPGTSRNASQLLKKFSPAKKELAVAEVDWEQHQAELIICNICKRRFFPHRIQKHSKSCKGM